MIAAAIRRIWDENRLTTADIAEMVGMPEAYVSRVVSDHVASKARARKQATRAVGGAS